MISETAITRWIGSLERIVNVAAAQEDTKIIPNLEVVDAAPTDPALSGYIVVQNDQGFNGPVLTVPGLTYTNGDLVNIIYIKGTEPIAFQQGSGSSGSNAGRVSAVYNPSLTTVVGQSDVSDDWEWIATNVYFDNTLLHRGDPDTGIAYTDDDILISAGGVNFIHIIEDNSQDQLVINDGSVDVDFRWESNNNEYMLFGDAGNDVVIVGGNTQRLSGSELEFNDDSGDAALVGRTGGSTAAERAVTFRAYHNDGTAPWGGYWTFYREAGENDGMNFTIGVQSTGGGSPAGAVWVTSESLVGIGIFNPDWPLHVSSDESVQAIFERESSGQAMIRFINTDDGELQTGMTGGGDYQVRDITNSRTWVTITAGAPADRLTVNSSGWLGVGASPKSGGSNDIFQVLNASFGVETGYATGVGTTPVTLVANGTPDVTAVALVWYVANNGGAVSANFTGVANSGTANIIVGTGTFQFAVSAAGALTIARVSGTGTLTLAVVMLYI